MGSENEILFLFHHIHHVKNKHEVHHCGGRHSASDEGLDYEIVHCKCGKHSINKEITVGHATSSVIQSIKIEVKFMEKCPFGGWHIESGTTLKKL
jgi:hypothetical protein